MFFGVSVCLLIGAIFLGLPLCVVLCFVGGDGNIIMRGACFDHGGGSWW